MIVQPSYGPDFNQITFPRNRLTIIVNGRLTAGMKHDLWERYGDAVDAWQLGTNTLAEPRPDWA